MSDRPEIAVTIQCGRTGSQVLGDLLNQHPDVLWRGEIFRGFKPVPIERRPPDVVRWLERPRAEAGERLFGFEVKPWHSRFTNLPLTDLLERLDARYRMRTILLWRRNWLRVLVSDAVARQTGAWHTRRSPDAPPAKVQMSIEPDEARNRRSLMEYMETAEQSHAWCRALLPEALDLTYEDDIEGSPLVGYDKARRHLGLSEFTPQVRLQRTAAFPLHQLIENYDQVRRYLKGTRFEAYCEEDAAASPSEGEGGAKEPATG